MSSRPHLTITADDPAGIGPEVVLRALAAPERPAASFSIYGPVAVLRDRATAPEALDVDLVDVVLAEEVPLGRSSAASGRAAGETVLAAARAARAGVVDGSVTAPLKTLW